MCVKVCVVVYVFVVCAVLRVRQLVCDGRLSSVIPALPDGYPPRARGTTRSQSPPKSHRSKTPRALKLDR